MPRDSFQLVGGESFLRKYSKKTDTDNVITSNFCGECGTTLWRESTGVPVSDLYYYLLVKGSERGIRGEGEKKRGCLAD